MEDGFFASWGDAALTTLGFFWMAFWAFALGYTVSSLIQVLVTHQRMQKTMGETGPRSVALATFFGFISSSCSFAALSATRAIFQKGAGMVPSLAFLLASTNLVIELGIIIFIFLSWQFVLGEYIGGVLLILVMWVIVKFTLPKRLEQHAREHAQSLSDESEDDDPPDPKQLATSFDGWKRIASRYFMEWGMVWKDVTFGFTVAGVIAVFVPSSFFQALFVGSSGEGDPELWQLVLHTFIGPVAAFFTFIGSMGNIPLAAILFSSGVSFAGIMAFIFSDLVVFPVLRISARYFGIKAALYILAVFLASLVVTSLVLHFAFDLASILPSTDQAKTQQTEPGERFKIDYTFFLNIAFLVLSGVFLFLVHRNRGSSDGEDDSDQQDTSRDQDKNNNQDNDNETADDDDSDSSSGSSVSVTDRVLTVLAFASFAWLAAGVVIYFVV